MNTEQRDAIRNMVRRGAILASDDSGDQQLLKLSGFSGEELRNVPLLQPWGLTGNPPAGGDVAVMALGGWLSRPAAIGGAHPQFRLKGLPVGGTVLYDAFLQFIKLIQDNIEISGTGTITIRAPNIILEGAIQIVGTVTGQGVDPINIASPINQTSGGFITTGDLQANGISLVGHEHPVSGVATGSATVSTGTPVG